MKKQDAVNMSEILENLSPISELLDADQIEELKDNISIKQYKKNEVMYTEGDVPQYFHCLISGKIKIFREGVGNRAQIVRIIKPVEYFGYRAYLANENYITSAASLESTTLYLIPMQVFDKWINNNPRLANYFVKRLAKELGRCDKRIVNLTQKHIRGRLAEALLSLKDTYGYETEDTTIAARLSREDLANLSNMTTSNAIRTLSSFSSEQLISVEGRKIKIINEDLLKKISKIG